MKSYLDITLHHKPCANRAWVTRRINQLLKRVARTLALACPGLQSGFVDVIITEHGVMNHKTSVRVDMDPFTDVDIKTAIAYFKTIENFSVEVLTIAPPTGTMPPCQEETEPQPPRLATQATC